MVKLDVAVIGGGPAGHFAAVTAAEAGKRVVLIEREPAPGGECVLRGTIPSKTLREAALAITSFKRRTGGVVPLELSKELTLSSLLERKREVIEAHQARISASLAAAGVEVWHGQARFRSARTLEVISVTGNARALEAELIVIATGSRPRAPPDVPIDHEAVLDSDSILSMTWLPRTLVVLGAGVIACEYATIFSALGVSVTIVDRGPRPLGFLDDELTSRFVAAFEAGGGMFLGGRTTTAVQWDGANEVEITLDDGRVLRADKVLCAQGRVANVQGLRLEAAGLSTNERGLIPVNERLETKVRGIVAVGDVIGPPSLASTSMEQGRRAIRHWLGQQAGSGPGVIPSGVYTIPELSSVGLTEAQARAAQTGVIVGRAELGSLARQQINASGPGLLKLVCDRSGQVLGVHLIGEGSAELVHLGQLALSAHLPVDVFVDDVFNFPTLAEAYRVAAHDVVSQRAARSRAAA